MFGIDDWIAGLSDGSKVAVALAIAILLGIRHASDPDHLAAVTSLLAAGRSRSRRGAARLGAAWGLGHATTLLALGLPLVLFHDVVPEGVKTAAETVVAAVIIVLAVTLLVRWRRGATGRADAAARQRSRALRSPAQAYGIGVVHGIGGTGGVGVLLLSTIHGRLLACAALILFAGCATVSMATLTVGCGELLGRARTTSRLDRLVPVLGVTCLAFGVWYALRALAVVSPSF